MFKRNKLESFGQSMKIQTQLAQSYYIDERGENECVCDVRRMYNATIYGQDLNTFMIRSLFRPSPF